MMSRTTTALFAISAAAVLLTGCAAGGDAPTPTVTETVTATPTPSPSPTDATTEPELPTDCAGLASEPTRTALVGSMTLQSDGTGFVRPAPDEARLALGCDWIEGESSGVLLLVQTASSDAVESALEGLPAEGYSCAPAEEPGGELCVGPGVNADNEERIFARGEVWIYQSTFRVNGDAFLSEIVADIFD